MEERLDFENVLSGENLVFYKNIEDLKILTFNARALITRSHTVFQDIVQGRELNKIVRGTDEEEVDSVESLHGTCIKCGLLHGAHDYCIVDEIISAEKKVKESSRKSVQLKGDIVELEENIALSSSGRKQPLKSFEKPTADKFQKWENLLSREMTPKEVETEYTRICCMYGVANAKKFLHARSLVREPDKVEPLFTDENRHTKYIKGSKKITSITKECVSAHEPNVPCPELSAEVRDKMATLLESMPPCGFKAFKEKTVWKNALKAKPKSEMILPESIEDDYSLSPSNSNTPSFDGSNWCSCELGDCDCDAQTVCEPPEKCQVITHHHTNYLEVIREKLRKRRLLMGKIPPEEYHRLLKCTSKEISYAILRKDSDQTMKKSYEINKTDLVNCVKSAIGKDDSKLDENASKVAEVTSPFTKPDNYTWDNWIKRFQTQGDVEEDEGISEDSEIPPSCSSGMSSSSTTDHEFSHPQSPYRRIPFAEEPLKLIDTLFDKIYARFRKSIQKSSFPNLFHPYKKFFITHVDHLVSLNCRETLANEVGEKLNLYFHDLKSLKPQKLLRAQRLKRLEAKNKKLLKTIRRRNYVEGVQIGKAYRRPKKSINFTKDQRFIGFRDVDRELLQKPIPDRFMKCDWVGDGKGVLLSKKKIHYHYRLLRTLFNGTMQSADKESLMDEGMKERLRNFKKKLRDSSLKQVATDSGTDGEVVSNLSSTRIQRPWKIDEKKLKSVPGSFPVGTRSNQNSRTLCSRLNGYVNASSLIEETHPRMHKTSSRRSSSNSWDDHANDLILPEKSISKASKNSSQRSKQFTQSGQTGITSKILPSQFRLPTPPLSGSSCDEFDCDIEHRVPSKEEAQMEKSARMDARTGEKPTNDSILYSGFHLAGQDRLDESELTDKSSDSYVPKLLKIPPKRAPNNSVSHAHRRSAYHRTIKGREKSPYSSDSSSTDTDPINHSRNVRKERIAWNHKSGLHRKIAPYIANNYPSIPNEVTTKSEKIDSQKITFTSPLPKAGRSILKKSSLPKPPSDGTGEKPSKTYGLDVNPVKRPTFSESSHKTTSRSGEGLVRPARVVTERLLKAAQGNPDDLPVGSGKKASAQSHATPERNLSSANNTSTSRMDGAPLARVPMTSQTVSSHVISTSASGKRPGGALAGASSSGPVTGDSAYSQHPSKKVSLTRHQLTASSDVLSGLKAESNRQTIDLINVPSSKQMIKKTSRQTDDAFRRRSLVPSDQLEEKESQSQHKPGDKAVKDKFASLQGGSLSSIAKIKKIAAIGPTKKKCFDLDIGQGINCINYLKENAPGADELKKRDLVDLIVTPIEVKKMIKKSAAKEEKDSSIASELLVGSQQSAQALSSSTSAIQPSKNTTKIQDQTVQEDTPLRKSSFKTLDQIYKEVHRINKNNTPKQYVENDYEYEAKKKQQLTKHKILP